MRKKIISTNSATNYHKKVHNYKYLQNSYIFNIHILVVNVEQSIMPRNSFEPQIIIRRETIYRLLHT